MQARPSEPLLRLLREVAGRKGLNTAALARAANIERARLKHVLSGSQAITVDEMIALSEALELAPVDLAGIAPSEVISEEPPTPTVQAVDPHTPATLQLPDPYGNHAEQILRLGFALGCDLHILLTTEELAGSGVPPDVLAKFDTHLPLRLNAAFHKHNDPRFLPEGIQLTLSFDSLHTCVFPWSAIQQVTVLPLAPEPTPDESADAESDKGHLRLVT